MPQLSTAAAATELADTLGEDIILGRIHPRERLVEDELMARFDAKRHIVRSALQLLVQRGLAERTPNVGVAVKSFTPDEVKDLYETRILLESNAVRLIDLPVSAESLAAVITARDDHRRAVERHNQPAIIEANDRFHTEIFLLTGNRILAETIGTLAQKASPIRFLNVSSDEKMQQSVAEHAAIVAALGGNDVHALAELCREHLIPTRDHYLETVTPKIGTRR